jgi:hypothetical protein
MPLIQIIVILAVVGLLLWGIGQFPIDPTIGKLIRVVVIVAACLWLLDLVFGFSFGSVYVGRRR